VVRSLDAYQVDLIAHLIAHLIGLSGAADKLEKTLR
jgi:hypothetical protein